MSQKQKFQCVICGSGREQTDISDNAQLAIFFCGVNNQFKVTEELLRVKAMQGCTTAKDVFVQLCDAIDHYTK